MTISNLSQLCKKIRQLLKMQVLVEILPSVQLNIASCSEVFRINFELIMSACQELSILSWNQLNSQYWLSFHPQSSSLLNWLLNSISISNNKLLKINLLYLFSVQLLLKITLLPLQLTYIQEYFQIQHAIQILPPVKFLQVT